MNRNKTNKFPLMVPLSSGLSYPIFVAALILCFCTVPPVLSQESQAPSADLKVKAENMIDSREALSTYIINPLDRLSIVVYAGDRQLNDYEELVKSDGTVYLSFLEQDVSIGGKMILDAEQMIQDLSRAYIKDPRIVLSVMNSYSQSVSTYGQIQTMDIELRTPMRILQVIARAGGPQEKSLADSIRVISADGTVRIFNYEKVNKYPNNRDNFYVKPGDIVFVPGYSDFSVTVLGNITTPGTYMMKNGARLLDALVLAGSWGENADIGNVRILRVRIGQRVEVKKIDIKNIFDKGTIRDNHRLQDGDIIFVPTAQMQMRLETAYRIITTLASLVSMIVLIRNLN